MKLEIETKKIEDVGQFWNDRMPMLAMEECGELIQAISKMERYPEDIDRRLNLIEEIRDMYISLMALQIKYKIPMFQIENEINNKLDTKK